MALIADRTFSVFRYEAQYLTGIDAAAPLLRLVTGWSSSDTDGVGAFLLAEAAKLVANDCRDHMIPDAASLKAGVGQRHLFGVAAATSVHLDGSLKLSDARGEPWRRAVYLSLGRSKWRTWWLVYDTSTARRARGEKLEPILVVSGRPAPTRFTGGRVDPRPLRRRLRVFIRTPGRRAVWERGPGSPPAPDRPARSALARASESEPSDCLGLRTMKIAWRCDRLH